MDNLEVILEEIDSHPSIIIITIMSIIIIGAAFYACFHKHEDEKLEDESETYYQVFECSSEDRPTSILSDYSTEGEFQFINGDDYRPRSIHQTEI